MKLLLSCLNQRNFMLLISFFSFGIVHSQMSNDNESELSVVKSFSDPALEWGPCPPFMPEGCNIAVVHGDPSQKDSNVLFKVNGNSSIPNHWHTSHERMVLLTGKMKVTYKGEKTQTMEVGDFAYGPAKKPHSAECISKDPCILYIGFGDPLDAFQVED